MKNSGNKEIPFAILLRILAQSCVTSPYINACTCIYMYIQANDCASILDSIAEGISLFP